MTRNKHAFATAEVLAALATTLQLTAQNNPAGRQQPNYRLIDVGTFGGPNAYFYKGPPSFGFLNGSGINVGHAGTTVSDPYPVCWNGDCVVYHAFRYDDGRLRDLGALTGTNSSIAVGINSLGVIAGISENGLVDPLTGYPATSAVVWNGHTMCTRSVQPSILKWAEFCHRTQCFPLPRARANRERRHGPRL
jgi:uncharacterized membrane protein